MPRGPLGGPRPFAKPQPRNFWCRVFFEHNDYRPDIQPYHLRQFEEDAMGLDIQDGRGQAYAKQSGPRGVALIFRTFYGAETSLDVEKTRFEARRLPRSRNLKGKYEIKNISVMCNADVSKFTQPSGTQFYVRSEDIDD